MVAEFLKPPPLLAVAYNSGHVHLLEAASLSLVQSVQYSTNEAWCMAYAPNGSNLRWATEMGTCTSSKPPPSAWSKACSTPQTRLGAWLTPRTGGNLRWATKAGTSTSSKPPPSAWSKACSTPTQETWLGAWPTPRTGSNLRWATPAGTCTSSKPPLSLVQSVQYSRNDVCCMAYAPNGEQLAVGYKSGHVHLLEAASLSLVRSVQYSINRAWCMAYAPNGEQLAVGYDSVLKGHVHFLEAASLSLVQSVQTFERGPECMAYAPNGEQLAVGYASGHMHLLEAASLSLVHSVQFSDIIGPECMAYAPNLEEPVVLSSQEAPCSCVHVIDDKLEFHEPATVISPEDAAVTADLLWSSHIDALVAGSASSHGQVSMPGSSGGRQVVLMTFSRCSAELDEALLASRPARVAAERGVDVQPSWAHGAKVFVEGLGPEHVEAPFANVLLPRHVVVSDGDVGDVLAALKHLPKGVWKWKPGERKPLLPDRLALMDISSEGTHSVEDDAGHVIEIEVRNTFIHFPTNPSRTRSVRSAHF